MDAVIYTRVSQDRNDGRSVEDQERECRAVCEREDWPVRAVFCDNSISASRYGKGRPEWERLKTELRQGDVLVMWEASRAARDLEEFVLLRNQCAQLEVPLWYGGKQVDLNLGDDRFTAGLDALLAERESEQTRMRVLRGKRAGALEGRPAGRVPWGYRMVSPGVWEPDPVEAPRIREAVERILAGESYSSVRRWLESTEGYTPLTVTVMNRSLRKPSLAGFRVHQGEILREGNWQPILTKEQHTRLVSRVERSRKAVGRVENPGPEPQHLLSHIAKCGTCGDGIPWRRKSGRGNPVYVCQKGHCSRLADPVDKAVEQALFERLAKVDPAQFEEDDPAVAALWDEVDAVERELVEFTDKAVAGEISAQSFALIEKGKLARIADLKAKAMQRGRSDVDLADVLQNWAELPMRDKRAIIRGFFTVTIHPAKRGNRVGLGGVEITPL